MTDPTLLRGDGWVRCCVCFEVHYAPYPDLYIDKDGIKWDWCKGCTKNVLGEEKIDD